jgi:hypothetical protein
MCLGLSLPSLPPRRGCGAWKLHSDTAKHPQVIESINEILNHADKNSPDIMTAWISLKASCIDFYKRAQKQRRQQAINEEKQALRLLATLDPSRHSSEVAEAKATLVRAAERRTHHAMIAAGLSWDLHSETPSRYLTARIKAREAQRLVTKNRHPTSQEFVTSTSDILDAFYTYYSAFYEQKTTIRLSTPIF